MLASVGVKARSGKEDTTLLSMVDRRVKQMTVSTTMIWNKTPDSRVSKGERTHRGSKYPSKEKKKKNYLHIPPTVTYGTRYGHDVNMSIVSVVLSSPYPHHSHDVNISTCVRRPV